MKITIFSLGLFLLFSYTIHAMDSSDDTSSSPKDSHFNPSDEEGAAIFWAEITARYTVSSNEQPTSPSASNQESNGSSTSMQRGAKRPAPESKPDLDTPKKKYIANISHLANRSYDFCAQEFPADTSDEAIQQALRENIFGIYAAQDRLHKAANRYLDTNKPIQALKTDFGQGLEILEKLQENLDTLMAAEAAFRISQKRRYARVAAAVREKLAEIPLLSE